MPAIGKSFRIGGGHGVDIVSIAQLTGLLATYGYLTAFLLIAIESMGIPVPGETMLITAAIYAGSTHHLHISLVIAAAASGAMLGDNLGYLIGRKGGFSLIRRFGKYVRVDERKLMSGSYLFQRHGGKAVFAGRFVAILRMWAAFLAGTYRMPWRRFMAANAAGAIVWASLYGAGGYYFGQALLAHGRTLGILSFFLGTGLMVALTLGVRKAETRLARAAHASDSACPQAIALPRLAIREATAA